MARKNRLPQPSTSQGRFLTLIIPHRHYEFLIQWDREERFPTGRISQRLATEATIEMTDSALPPELIAALYDGIEIRIELGSGVPTGNLFIYEAGKIIHAYNDAKHPVQLNHQLIMAATGQTPLPSLVVYVAESPYKLRGATYYNPNEQRFRFFKNVPRTLTEEQAQNILKAAESQRSQQ